jgi:hypothetical protein
MGDADAARSVVALSRAQSANGWVDEQDFPLIRIFCEA